MEPTSREGSLLRRTCETCFKAKIRCDRSEASGPCDRCLRLGKACVFIPTKKRNAPVPHARRIEQMEAKIDRILTTRPSRPSPSRAHQLDDDTGLPLPLPLPPYPAPAAANAVFSEGISTSPAAPAPTAMDPLAAGVLTAAQSDALLEVFRTKMAAHFPFIVLPDQISATQLLRTRPSLCLAVLAVASFNDPQRQQALGKMFNELVAARLVAGTLVDLDLLQGLLVRLAWTQYEPKPARYSQFLHLAISIVSDLRLDRPRNPRLWMLDGSGDTEFTEWGAEELRALVGAYYLSSSSSTVLQKLRSFSYSSFLLESAADLAGQAAHPTDKYLPYIVRVQRLSEQANDLAEHHAEESPSDDLSSAVARLRGELDALKSAVTFPFSECPTLLLQVNTLSLQISQLCLPGFPFAPARVQDPGVQLVCWLSDSISAAKTVADVFITMSPAEEFVMTNMGWIMCGCGLSLAARLDILAADSRISASTEHLRRLLDIRHVLKQVLLRLEAAVSSLGGSGDKTNTMARMLRRAQVIEAWYLRQTALSSLSTPSGTKKEESQITGQTNNEASMSGPSHPPELPGAGGEVEGSDAQAEIDFSIMEIWGDMDAQGISFGPSMFTSDFQSFG